LKVVSLFGILCLCEFCEVFLEGRYIDDRGKKERPRDIRGAYQAFFPPRSAERCFAYSQKQPFLYKTEKQAPDETLGPVSGKNKKGSGQAQKNRKV
jgi:hypothetical protein